jgi:hypothetical protein
MACRQLPAKAAGPAHRSATTTIGAPICCAAHKEDVMKIIGIVIIGSALLAAGAVAAKESPNAKRQIDASEYYGLYYNYNATAPASSAAIGRSGTAGREDFGESPFYPEGPGNVAD